MRVTIHRECHSSFPKRQEGIWILTDADSQLWRSKDVGRRADGNGVRHELETRCRHRSNWGTMGLHRINKNFWGQTVKGTGEGEGHNLHNTLSEPEAMALSGQESCSGEKTLVRNQGATTSSPRWTGSNGRRKASRQQESRRIWGKIELKMVGLKKILVIIWCH